MKSKRKDFSYPTKLKIAAYCNNMCAFPTCAKKVLGGRINADDLENGFSKGVFAHIIGASSKGPRHTTETNNIDLDDVSNGILLCEEHHKLIDDNEEDYPIEVLKQWKAKIESNFKNLLFIKDYKSWNIEISSLVKSPKFGQESSEICEKFSSSNNHIVRIEGEIGVGKKTFVKYCCSLLSKELQEEILIIQANDLDLGDFSMFNRIIKSKILILLDASPEYNEKLVERIKHVNPIRYKVISIGIEELFKKNYNDSYKYVIKRLNSKESD